MSKRSAKSDVNDFYPKNFKYACLPKLKFESYKNDANSRYEDEKTMMDAYEHQIPDYPSTFMKMI
jgi:hypothetical protein